MSLTRTILAAALGLAVVAPAVVAPAAAQDVRIRVRHDNGWHRGWDHHRHGCRVTVVRRHTPHGTVVRRMKVCR